MVQLLFLQHMGDSMYCKIRVEWFDETHGNDITVYDYYIKNGTYYEYVHGDIIMYDYHYNVEMNKYVEYVKREFNSTVNMYASKHELFAHVCLSIKSISSDPSCYNIYLECDDDELIQYLKTHELKVTKENSVYYGWRHSEIKSWYSCY